MIGVIKKMLLALPLRKKSIVNPDYMTQPPPKHNHLTTPPRLIRLKWHDGVILRFYTEKDLYVFWNKYGDDRHVIRETEKINQVKTYERRSC
jgi:hypothetical protein